MSDPHNGPTVPFYQRQWSVIILVCLLLAVSASLVLVLTGRLPVSNRPDGQAAQAADRDASPSNEQTADNGLVACDSPEAAGIVKNAIEGDGSTQVLDFGRAEETFFDKAANVRHCGAQTALSQGGAQLVAYQIYLGPSGKLLVQAVFGDQAGRLIEQDLIDKQSAQNREAAKAGAENVAGASAQCDVPTLPKGLKYQGARSRLLSMGAHPKPTETPEEGSYCADTDHAGICKAMPEIQDCSADGYCKMTFVSKAGAQFDVTIFGDGPDDSNASVEMVKSECHT